MKRKQPTTNGAGKPAAPKPAAAATGPAKSAQKSAAAPQPKAKQPQQQQKFAQPMRRLDDFSEDEEDDEESARHDRKHMQRIEADENEDDDDEEAPSDEEDEDAEAEEEEDAEMDGDEDDAAEAEEQASAEEEEEAAGPVLELDLPLQVVQGTYSGVLYGLKTKESLRKIRAYHTKLHSKKGLEEADINEDEEDDDLDDDLDDSDDEEATAEAGATAAAAGQPATPAASATSSFGLLFTNAAHIGSIKAMAISSDGKWMVSGGMDETIKIFKTAVMREFGQLHQHSGSVVALEFYGSGFLLSGGQEGDLCLWNTKTWQLLRKFTGAHEGSAGSSGGVSCLSVHPSGRVALSVGGVDRKVKIWDLMKGQLASERKMDFAVTAVKWAIGGEQYALMGEKRFDIYDTESKLLRREEVSETKLLSLVWLSPSMLALGCEDKTVRVHSATSGECVATLQGHQVRVRGLDAVTVPMSGEADAKKCTFLASADTNGQTFLWDLTTLVAANPETSGSLAAIHPCCSSFHDQRVTILRILPHWTARKDDAALKTPIQTHKAEEKQQAVMDKKAAANTAAAGKQLTPAEAKAAKAKRLFEKTQRTHAAKQQAAAKAKRLLAKMNPRLEGEPVDGEDADGAPAKKKAKATFEEAPMVDSDDEAPPPAMKMKTQQESDDDDDEDEEDEPAPVAPAKKKPAQPQPSAPKPAAPAQKQPQQKAAQKSSTPQAAAPQAKKKQAKAAPAGESPAHTGFSAAIPMFKPKLTQQRGKKKSDAKIARDAARKQSRK